jgi:hypothetical protein
MGSAAEEEQPRSLYIPKAHLIDDRQFLHDFMDEYSFVDLVTASPEIRITHVPALLDRALGNTGSFTATSLARILKAGPSMAGITQCSYSAAPMHIFHRRGMPNRMAFRLGILPSFTRAEDSNP